MSQQLGPIDVLCDAPPYSIVESCATIGIVRPADVRWYRMTNFLADRSGWRGAAKRHLWKIVGGVEEAGSSLCSCGEELPILDGYTFTFTNGEEVCYRLGQCPKCHTVFWEPV
jgi:hypothetical protein